MAKKDKESKVSLQEIYPGFIKEMGKRMSENKGKYQPFNWTLMNHEQIPEMLDACERHLLDLKSKLIYGESIEEEVNEQLAAMACNSMIIFYILYGQHDNFRFPG